MIKVLFLIHDLGQGGAEKVLVNLVNNMDKSKFDVTVMTLFDVGVNKQFLSNDVHYKYCFKHMIRGNSHLMKVLTPRLLHNWLIKDHYDIEIAYLEGPSARVISGCTNKNTKLISWLHVEQHTIDAFSAYYRSIKEMKNAYLKFDKVIGVSEYVKNDFLSINNYEKPCEVLYNTVESDRILSLSKEDTNKIINDGSIKLVAVGTLKQSKGYDRLLRVINNLVKDGYNIHLYILGIGSMENELKEYVSNNHLESNITFLGYDTNPYKYVSKCDLFVCASLSEGFSTAATESLIVGTPVCTVEVSGMKEMLGENNEYGIVVDNTEEALYKGIQTLLDDRELLDFYQIKAKERGQRFSTKNTVKSVEEMLEEIIM